MAAKKRFVHVRKDGNQVFFKGDTLELSDENPNVVKIQVHDADYDAETVGVVFLAESESVGEWFAPVEKETKK